MTTAPSTLAQKLVARAAGRAHVTPGEFVTCAVDLAMFHDSSGPRRLQPMLAELGAEIWDKQKVVLVIDHYVPEADDESRRIVRIARAWAAAQALPHVYDSLGICHVVVPQHGHIRPGMFCVGGDSHSPTGGAFGAYMFGIGATEMLGVVVTGQIWLQVPQTIFMQWQGRLARGVSAKDMMLAMIGRFGMNGGRYQAVEFCGSASRPPHSEGLAVFIASYLAHETALPNINLLHLSSRKAVQAAMMMADVFPHIDFRREVTIGHLMLDTTSRAAELAKVNPPIRPRENVEFLWQALLAGELGWVCSDHACCRHETKIPPCYFGNIWMAKSGFGGTEYLLPALVSEGSRRGMGYNHMARVTSWNPAQRYGLSRKGDIAAGFDADIALVDPRKTWVIAAADSPSTQGYTPFEGLEMSARVDATFLRGMMIFEDGQVLGKPRGQYLHRPS